MKTRWENNVIDHTSAIHTENKTELSWPIGLGVICDENQIGQQRDRLYRYDLRQKQYWTIVTNQNYDENRIGQWCDRWLLLKTCYFVACNKLF